MDTNQSQHAKEAKEDVVSLSPGEQISGLVTDVRNLAEAEWDYAKARLSYSGGIVRKAGIYALLAVFAISGAIVALILGTLLIIASYWGPWVATAVTVIMFTIAAISFALLAKKTAKNLSFSESDDG
jgi:hypothetical protein